MGGLSLSVLCCHAGMGGRTGTWLACQDRGPQEKSRRWRAELVGHQRPEAAVAVRSVPRVRDRSQVEVSAEDGRRASCVENWGERAGTLRSRF